MKSWWLVFAMALFSIGGGWMAPVWQGKEAIAIALFAVPFLLVGSLPVLWLSIKTAGSRHAMRIWLGLSLFAYTIEKIGVQTGFPYGDFSYRAGSGPFILGVPVWLPLAWVPLILGVWQCVVRSVSQKGWRIFWTAILLVMIDLVLDPGAVALNLWRYQAIRDGGSMQYYFVPWTNFFGWFLSGAAGAALLERLSLPTKGPLILWLFPTLIGLGFWLGVNLRAAHTLPTLLGAGLLAIFFLKGRDEYRAL